MGDLGVGVEDWGSEAGVGRGPRKSRLNLLSTRGMEEDGAKEDWGSCKTPTDVGRAGSNWEASLVEEGAMKPEVGLSARRGPSPPLTLGLVHKHVKKVAGQGLGSSILGSKKARARAYLQGGAYSGSFLRSGSGVLDCSFLFLGQF